MRKKKQAAEDQKNQDATNQNTQLQPWYTGSAIAVNLSQAFYNLTGAFSNIVGQGTAIVNTGTSVVGTGVNAVISLLSLLRP